ncbi:MAG: 6-phosphogluconolactonase [Xanthobacteraceae bacterium]
MSFNMALKTHTNTSADTPANVVAVADAAALATAAARRLIARVATGGRSAVCLTGGSSPQGLYRLLAVEPWRSQVVPWDRVHWFMGDDRFVPQSDPLSNMGAARTAFLDATAPSQNIHAIATNTGDPETAAQLYEDELKKFYGADRLDPAHPLFDLVLMGLGGDGHTASLFPHAPALAEKTRWVVGVAKAGMEPHVPRVTLTLPTLASTREMLFLVDGADKRAILARVLGHEDLPAHRAYSNGELVWLIDRAAASETTA